MFTKLFKTIFLLFLGCGFCSVIVVYGQQSKEDLQKQEDKLRKEIQDLNQQLKNASNSKKNSLAQIKLLQQKISTRQKLSDQINQQIKYINNEIVKNTSKISELSNNLYNLKSEYAKIMVFNYQHRQTLSMLNFLASTASFNTAYKELFYLKKYHDYQISLQKNIENSSEKLTVRMENLKNDKKKRELKVNASTKEIELLKSDKKEEDNLLKSVESQVKTLEEQVAQKEKQRIKTQQLIKEIIRKEVLEAAKRDKEKNKSKTSSNQNNASVLAANDDELVALKEKRPYSALENSVDDIEQSIQFENNKGKLPWPVDKGSIDVSFGISTIPNTKLTRKSDGIEISVPPQSNVKCVADGLVIKISELDGSNIVMVLHGKYVSVYSQLSSVSVKTGQQLKGRTVIGKAGLDLNGEGVLIFMITNEKGNFLNPEQWLKPKSQ